MNEKSIAKKYLISIILLYVIGAAVLFLMAYSIVQSGRAVSVWSTERMLMFSLCYSLVPCGSYAGFCNAFMKVETLSKNAQIILAVLFPIVLVLITVYGIIMIIPSIIKSVVTLIKKD